EHRTLQRSSELNNILEQFRRAIAETNSSKDALTNFSDETQKLLKELANRKPLQVPNIYHHLPHLLNNEGSLHPAVQVGLGRTGVTTFLFLSFFLSPIKQQQEEEEEEEEEEEDGLDVTSAVSITMVMGIPTVSGGEVLSVGDAALANRTSCHRRRNWTVSLSCLLGRFSTELSSGVLEVDLPTSRPIKPPPNSPNLKGGLLRCQRESQSHPTTGFIRNRLWCSLYSDAFEARRTEVFVSVRGCLWRTTSWQSPTTSATMKNFALQLSSEDWDDSGVFSARLHWKDVQAPDLNLIVEFIFMFYKEKPIDWLLDHILWVKVCNPEKDAVYQGHTLEKTYLGEDFFWAITPTAGDYVLFKLTDLSA
ncbi:hypothetical protein GBF38_016867, partial [Nibea albiflora]